MGKGDTRRLSSVSKEEYDANFESIFGKKELKQWGNVPEECAYCQENFDGFGVGVCPVCRGHDGWLLEDQNE